MEVEYPKKETELLSFFVRMKMEGTKSMNILIIQDGLIIRIKIDNKYLTELGLLNFLIVIVLEE